MSLVQVHYDYDNKFDQLTNVDALIWNKHPNKVKCKMCFMQKATASVRKLHAKYTNTKRRLFPKHALCTFDFHFVSEYFL